MFKLLKDFWNDECGAVVTAEVGLLATLGIIGATVGLSSVAKSVDEELKETAAAFRSLDQSYCYRGFCSPYAATAGSCYQQPPVKQSLKKLRQYERQLEKKQKEPDNKRRQNKNKRKKRRNRESA